MNGHLEKLAANRRQKRGKCWACCGKYWSERIYEIGFVELKAKIE
jgi:hypothetical protein